MKRRKSLIIAALVGAMLFAGNLSAYEEESQRQTFTAYKSQRGTTVNIPYETIEDLCGDWDGCTLRMGMHDWDGTGRTASREALFYYDITQKTWRMSLDTAGTNNSNTTEHVMQIWSCYFTDGEYLNWYDRGDFDLNFGLLSWNQYNANCKLTIID